MDAVQGTTWRVFSSAVLTMTLGILGSSVLPIPWAFSRTGIIPGLLISLVIAMVNAYTGTLLLRAASHLRKGTYESLTGAALGARAWRLVAEVALICLLFGTLAGDAALLADTGALAIKGLTRDQAPAWLTLTGRIPMLALIVVLVLPLSLTRQMLHLERAAACGVICVLALTVVIVQQAVAAGLPAIASGELPLWGVPCKGELGEAVAIISFAFYMQPMLLPLLSEMPPGPDGSELLIRALKVVTVGIAPIMYSVVGVFGAARWGLATEGDTLVNRWLPGRLNGALAAFMAVYLSISAAPMAITMRYLLDSVAAGGELTAYQWRRDASFTVAGLASATAVALAWPEQAEKLFAITGASAVCLVSYVLPVAVHLCLYLKGYRLGRWWHSAGSTDATAWLLEDAALLEQQGAARRESSVLAPGASGGLTSVEEQALPGAAAAQAGPYPTWRELGSAGRGEQLAKGAYYVVLPVLVLCLGIAVSGIGLVQAITKF